ncbi:hypothetical protein [Mycoplasmopsis columboralis]|uniref:Uncharacterized protein n=1 Tax=Mycoplasmopsis columboralis TaxID=171282 RepID=A0A449B634_9BACT|nr:hypothetical protein [Mycoplasmopsis columboralis]VEU76073.1 Uncharacterised protein [Mycoplasmopsis columboralis]
MISASVKSATRIIEQPSEGFLKTTDFQKIRIQDGIQLHKEENIHGNLTLPAIDHLTKFMLGENIISAFWLSWCGSYSKYLDWKEIKYLKNYYQLINEITGLDDQSIINACKLVSFDICSYWTTDVYKPIEEINPDAETIENIRTIVQRNIKFFHEFGPILSTEFPVEDKNEEVNIFGEIDYVTYDTLWIIKPFKNSFRKERRLELLMYYIMGWHSEMEMFKKINKIGYYNPRKNIVYTMDIHRIDPELIKWVSEFVLKYPKEKIHEHLSKYKELSKIKQRKEDYSELNVYDPEERKDEEFELAMRIYEKMKKAIIQDWIFNSEYDEQWKNFMDEDFNFDMNIARKEENRQTTRLIFRPWKWLTNKLKKKTEIKLLE